MTDFYDKLSSDYDQMTNAQKRINREKPFFQQLLDRYQFRTALDIGCGTGQTMINLSELKVETLGIDPSKEMLNAARDNLKEYKHLVRLVEGDFLSIPAIVKAPVDAVFCLGNTLPHLLTGEHLKLSFANIRNVIKQGGIFVLQMLNYHKILLEKRRIVNITRHESKTFIRFYDFLEPHLSFNILVLEESQNGFDHKLYSTELHPWEAEDIYSFMNSDGYNNFEVFGDFAFNRFVPEKSDNLVIIAKI